MFDLMPTEVQFSLIAIAIYLLALGYVVYRGSRKETASDYVIGGREVGVWALTASLSSSFRDGAGIAAWIVLGAAFGWGAMWLMVGLALGLLLLASLAPKVRDKAAANSFVTVGDAIRKSIGPHTAFTSSLIIAATSLLLAAAQLFVSGSIFSELLRLPTATGIWLSALVVGAYLLIGGYRTVVRTDVLQWLFIMVIVVLPFFLTPPAESSLAFSSFLDMDSRTIIGFMGISLFWVLSSADVWQRLYSAKSPQVARRAFLFTIPVYTLISIGLVLLAFAITTTLPNVSPEQSFFAIFSSNAAHPVVIALLGVFALTAMMSTLDTQVFLFASTVAKNLLPCREQGDEHIRKTSRITIALLLIILAVIASSIGSIVEFLFSAGSLGTILLPVVLYAALGKENEQFDGIVQWCLIAAVALYVFMFARGAFSDVFYTVVPALASVALFSGVLLLSNNSSNATN